MRDYLALVVKGDFSGDSSRSELPKPTQAPSVSSVSAFSRKPENFDYPYGSYGSSFSRKSENLDNASVSFVSTGFKERFESIVRNKKISPLTGNPTAISDRSPRIQCCCEFCPVLGYIGEPCSKCGQIVTDLSELIEAAERAAVKAEGCMQLTK